MRARFLVGVLLCGAAVACGRTGLDGPLGGGPGGTSSSVATTTGSTTSSSSSGGAGGCGLAPFSPSVELTAPGAGDQGLPALASPSSSQVTIAYRYRPTDLPPPPAPALVQTTFEPWGTWPTGPLGPSHVVAQDGGTSFGVAHSASTPLVFAFEGPPPPQGGLRYTEAFPTSDNPPAFPVDAVDDRVRFLVGGSFGLIGYERGAFDLAATLVKELPEGPYFQGQLHLGCATTPLVSDAIADGTGFIVALANGLPLGALGCGAAGPATQVQVGRVSATGGVVAGGTVGQALPKGDESEAVPWLRMAPHLGGGAWVLWYGAQFHGEDAPPPALELSEFDPALQLKTTITVNGTVANPAGDLPHSTDFAITAVGQRLVVAWLNDMDGGADGLPEIVVEILDASGHEVDVMKIPPVGGVSSPMSLVPSPNEDAALLAWASADGDPKLPNHVHVVRICVSQPV